MKGIHNINRWSKMTALFGIAVLISTAHADQASAENWRNVDPLQIDRSMAVTASPLPVNPLDGVQNQLQQSIDKSAGQMNKIRPLAVPAQPAASPAATRSNSAWGWLGLLGLAGLFGLFKPAWGNADYARNATGQPTV